MFPIWKARFGSAVGGGKIRLRTIFLSNDLCSEFTAKKVEEIPICDQYTIQGDVFSRAIRGDEDVPVSIEDAVQNMAVIEAVFRSAESGRWETPEKLSEKALTQRAQS